MLKRGHYRALHCSFTLVKNTPAQVLRRTAVTARPLNRAPAPFQPIRPHMLPRTPLLSHEQTRHYPSGSFSSTSRFMSTSGLSDSPPSSADGDRSNQGKGVITDDTDYLFLGRREPMDMRESLPRVEKTLQERKDAIDALDEYLVGLEQRLTPTMKLLEMTEDVIERLDRNVMSYLPTFKPTLDIYGSYLSGLYSPGSDLDMTLTGNAGTLRPQDVESMLRYYRYKSVRSLEHMKEYVVQFVDPVTNIRCDLCLNQSLAIQNSLLIGTYVKLDPRVRRLVYAIKQMTRHCGIWNAKRGHISNYAYTMWIITFLQMQNPPILPKLQPPLPPVSLESATFLETTSSLPGIENETTDNETTAQVNGRTLTRVFIDGHDCTFDDDWEQYLPLQSAAPSTSAGELLLAFLEYFGYEHDYINLDIHTRTSTIEPRPQGIYRLGKLPSPRLRILDPFLPNRDLGAGARIGGAMRIRETFQEATNAILERDFERIFGDEQ